MAALREGNMLACSVRGIVGCVTVIRGHRMPKRSKCIGDATETRLVWKPADCGASARRTHEGAMAGTVWTLVVRLAVAEEQKGEQWADYRGRKRLWIVVSGQSM